MKSIFELGSFSLLCGDTLEHFDLLRWNLASSLLFFSIKHLKEHNFYSHRSMIGIIKTK